MGVVYFFFGGDIFLLYTTDPVILDYGAMIMRILSVILFMQIEQVFARRRRYTVYRFGVSCQCYVYSSRRQLAVVLSSWAGTAGRVAGYGLRPVRSVLPYVYPFPKGQLDKTETLIHTANIHF